jgi:hypothetical protein
MTAEAVIAIASGVQAVATVVLVAVTIRYVGLTRGLLATSQAQLSDARALLDAALEVSKQHLLALLGKIEPILSPLPPVGIPVEMLRRSGIWAEADETKLVELAARVDPTAAAIAGRLAPPLAWLRGLQDRIARSDDRHGFGVDDKTNLLYHQHRAAAANEIGALRKQLS